MNARLFPATLVAAIIGLCALTADEPSRRTDLDENEKAKRHPQEKTERLPERCRKLRALQVAVYDGTNSLHKKPSSNDQMAFARLSNDQKTIIAEAKSVLDDLNAGKAAAAFSEVFKQLCMDMERVQSRLESGDVGSATQAMEKEIIGTLEEITAALKPGH
jgi:hypothetical protein